MTIPVAFIIEDDRKLANIFSIVVQQAGFEAEIIAEGQDALTRLADTIPSLIVLDLHLPKCSGEEILQQIKADERLAEVKIILATADALRAERLRAEVDLALLKPIDPLQLRSLATRLRPPSAHIA